MDSVYWPVVMFVSIMMSVLVMAKIARIIRMPFEMFSSFILILVFILLLLRLVFHAI